MIDERNFFDHSKDHKIATFERFQLVKEMIT